MSGEYAYDALLAGRAKNQKSPPTGAFALYPQSQALSPAMRPSKDNIFAKMARTHGETPLSAWKWGDIAAGRDKRAATPAAARHFVEPARAFPMARRSRPRRLRPDCSAYCRQAEERRFRGMERRRRREVSRPPVARDARACRVRGAARDRLAPGRRCAGRSPSSQGRRDPDLGRKDRRARGARGFCLAAEAIAAGPIGEFDLHRERARRR